MDERTIFLNALDKNEPQERAKYLQEACGENKHLRRQVEELLRASRDAGEFLESPSPALVATIASGAIDAALDAGDEAALDFLAPCDKPGCLGRLAQYEVVEVVGRGGMGLVLRAFDSKLNRVVAIKVMAPELAANPMAVKRFLREAKAAAAVSHDHVVTIHSIHDTQRPPFLVMEFVDGQSLQQKVDRVGALELQGILRIGMQTASGLAAAHKQGLVHRDIKPANILLENGVERVKITDFGLARMNDDIGVTQTGQIAGTPQYMSPEQAQGQPVDARSDLFSLGSVLYTMCAGRPPFRGDSAVAMLRRVCDDDPRPIRQINAEVPEWLEAIIDTLLAKSPDDRFQSAEEVADLLGRYLAHLQHPVASPMPNGIAAPRRPASRSAATRHVPAKPPRSVSAHEGKERWGWVLTAAMLAAIVLLAALGGAVWLYRSTNHGTVVFESPVDNLEIERLKNGRVERIYDTQHGGRTRWRVPVGDWEFRIKGGGAAYDLEPDRIRFTRGSRATIRVVPLRPADGVGQITQVRRFGDLHTRPLADIALVPSAKGRLVATTGYDGTVRVWDVDTGKEARPFLHHEEARIRSVAASPDGKMIAAGDHTGAVHLWDVENGNLRRTLAAGPGYVYDLAFSHDGARLYVGTAHYAERLSGSVIMYDAASWERLRVFEAIEQAVHTIAPLANDARVLAGGEFRMGGVWDSETGRMLTRFRDLPTHAHALAPSPDGAVAAIGFPVTKLRDERFDDPDAPGIWLCEVETGRLVRKLRGHTGNVTCLAWSGDGRFLVSSSGGRHMSKGFLPAWDNTLRVWDVEKGAEIARVEVNAGAGVRSLVLLPDGRHVVTAGGDEGKPDLCLWRLPETVWPDDENRITEIRRFGELHTRPLADVALVPSAEKQLVVTAGYDGTVRIWDVETGSPMDLGDVNPKSAAVSPEGKTIAVRDHAGKVYLWDAEHVRIRSTLTLGSGYVYDLAFAPDGSRLYVGMGHYPDKHSGAVVVYDVASGERICQFEGAEGYGHIVAPLPDGVRVLAAGEYKRGGVWDAESGRLITPFRDLPQTAYALSAAPDGALAAIGFRVTKFRDNRFDDPDSPGIWLYDVKTGRFVRKLPGHTGNVNALAWSADGRFLVSGSGGRLTAQGFVSASDNTIRVWNVETGGEIARVPVEAETGVRSLVLLPDGRHAVTAGGDEGRPDLRLWRLPQSVWPGDSRTEGEFTELRRYEGHSEPVSSLAVSRDGRSFGADFRVSASNRCN